MGRKTVTRAQMMEYVARVKELRSKHYTYETIREILYRESGIKLGWATVKKMALGQFEFKKMYDDEREKIAEFIIQKRKEGITLKEIGEMVKKEFNISLCETTLKAYTATKRIGLKEAEEIIKKLRTEGKTHKEIKEIMQSKYGRTFGINVIKDILGEEKENFEKDITSLKDKKLEEAGRKMGIANYWFNKAVPGATLITKGHDELEVLSKHTHFVLCTNRFEKVCVPKSDILKVEAAK